MTKANMEHSATHAEYDAQFARLVDDVIDRIQAGQAVDLAALVRQQPEAAERLRRLLPTLEAMAEMRHGEGIDRTLSSAAPVDGGLRPGVLGDFQILHEIGRGGMGVVYEAQQISLARRVALKVLPFAAVMDPRQLARFKNEAQAAATLDHPNIVSVYAIGCDRSVHYFAMQYVAGQTLAEAIRDLRQRAGMAGENHGDSATASYLLSGKSGSHERPAPTGPAARPAASSAPTARPPQAAITTQQAGAATFFHNAARLGIQAAEALDHAHQRGVIHRDIKPGNLMLDATGKLWVTDFGLARVEGDAGMTMTGDLLGTMRYMSPEQALAKRVMVDHRTDIYSLGVTLYELLALRPAFAGGDRQELLRQIAFDEPKLPHTWNKAIPADLETIVLKAMAKDARDRYATAQELADDLRRYLADQPIRARRPGLVVRARKWSRRHRAIVTTAGAVAACALVLGAGLLLRERSQTLAALARADANFHNTQHAVDKYFTTVSQNTLLDAMGMEPLRKELLQAAVEYYQGFVAEHAGDPALKAELAAAHIRLGHVYADMGSNRWIDELSYVFDIIEPLAERSIDVSKWSSLAKGQIFRDYRRGYIHRQDAARIMRVTSQGIRLWEKLVNAHPDIPGFASDLAGLHHVQALVLLSNPATRTAARSSFETAVAYWERLPIQNMGAVQLSFGTALSGLADLYGSEGDNEAAYRYGRRAINALTLTGSPYRIQVLATRDLASAYDRLARTAIALGRTDEAEDILARALESHSLLIEMDPQDADPYSGRAKFYRDQGRYLEAIADCNKGIELGADAGWFALRGEVYEKAGEVQKAIEDYKKAIELEPDNVRWSKLRAIVQSLQGQGVSGIK